MEVDDAMLHWDGQELLVRVFVVILQSLSGNFLFEMK